MSWYINYYLGYRNKNNNKIYPLGIFDVDGNIYPAYYKSRHSELKDISCFRNIKKEEISDQLKKVFPYEDWEEKESFYNPMQIMNASELCDSDFIKSGYLLIDDIVEYNSPNGYEDVFSNSLTAFEYAERLKNELLRNNNTKQNRNENEDEYQTHDIFDYTYYAYPDFDSAEYESFLLKQVIEIYNYIDYKTKDGHEIMILKSEG